MHIFMNVKERGDELRVNVKKDKNCRLDYFAGMQEKIQEELGGFKDEKILRGRQED